jgi:predicted methyltransferase
MTVIEVSPGSGYYTEILAPFLAQRGQYFMAIPRMTDRPTPLAVENEKKLQEILLRKPEVQANSKFVPLEPIDKRNRTKPEFADAVLVFNTLHNWVARNEVESSLKFAHEVLRPGGTLGIIQHRIAEGKKKVPKSGYMTEAEVITMARQAGFKLVEKSELNANPKDSADYPLGVWVLPPTYRLGDKDRKKYQAIGESDKMTLKFIK